MSERREAGTPPSSERHPRPAPSGRERGKQALRVATRASPLARRQAERVVELLDQPCELVAVTTTGDRRADTPIHEMGGTGVFVKEVQQAVLDGRAELAVHSAKDLPAVGDPGLVLAAIPERADPRDALVGASLDAIPTGGLIGTGSVRRRAQLVSLRPDLEFVPLRGNIATRLEKAKDLDAVVVALCALERLDLGHRASEVLDTHRVLPQVGQGALAVECRADDGDTASLLARIDHASSRREVVAERAFLERLGGGCELPCGALARTDGERVAVDALLASLDGHVVLRASAADRDPQTAGVEAARVLLDEQGGHALLEGW